MPLWKIPTHLTTADSIELPADDPRVRLASLYNDVMDWGPVEWTREWLEPATGGVLRKFTREVSFGAGWNWERRPEISVRMSFPPGHPIGRADTLMAGFENTALASESVSRTLVDVREESASMRVQFHPEALMTSEPHVLRERLISLAGNVGGIYIYVGGLVQDGFSSGFDSSQNGILLKAVGPNYEDLDRMVADFSLYLQGRSRRVAGVDGNSSYPGRFQQARQVISIDWDADAEARSRVTARDVAGALSPYFRSRFPFSYSDMDGDIQLPIRLEVEGAYDRDMDRVVVQPLQVRDSLQIQLAGLAEYTVEERPTSIVRENQQYIRYINVDFRGPSQMASTFIERELEAYQTNAGYGIYIYRSSFVTDKIRDTFGWLLMAAFFLVYLVTASVFESWKLPLIVLLSVPMAGFGLALAFVWTGDNFAEGALIGTILMVGISVNDAILLTDRYRQLRELRTHGRSSVLMRLAVRERLRPMITTTLTTIVAMLPMIVFPDNSDFWLGMSTSVVGGLSASTILGPIIAVSCCSMQR